MCSGCQSFYGQPLAKLVEQTNEKSGNVNVLFKIQSGPPVSGLCPECGSSLHVSNDAQKELSLFDSLTRWQDPCGTVRSMMSNLSTKSYDM